MSKLTIHRLIFLFIFGVVYSFVHIYFNMDIDSYTVGAFFGMSGSIIWDVLFCKPIDWKDKYQ